jgi:ubiquinone/menaquinone biosynthesis C-methylase UbiE
VGLSDVAASGFGAGAADYERGRPSYPDDVVAWLVSRLGVGGSSVVVDLAAGTGKLTRLLVPTGAQVVAVEPVAAMRDQLLETCPEATVVEGTAESTGLPDGAADAVTVAQAFHWFDPVAALAEIARVLRPRCHLGLVFNERDTREPWVAELSRLIRWDERERWRVPYTVEVDWAATIAEAGPQFEPAERFATTFRQEMDVETLVARVLSTSYLAVLPTGERDRLADDVRALAEPLGATFELPYVTVAYAARRR